MDIEEHTELELEEELTALQIDEEKLKLALQEYDDDWDYASDDEDDEDGRYIIDLDRESSDQPGKSAQSAASINSAHSSAGSVSHSKQDSLQEDEDSQGAGGQNEVGSNLLTTSYNDDDLVSATVGAADPEKALALNRALQAILEGHIEAIQEAIETNQDKQSQLDEDPPNHKRAGISTTCPARSAKCLPFRAPYFRIGNEYPEPNEDVKTKNRLGQARLSTPAFPGRDVPMFHGKAKQILRKSVIEDYSIQRIKPLMSRHDAEIERRDKVKARKEDEEIALEGQREQLKLSKNGKEKIEIKFRIHELEQNLRDNRNKLRQHENVISMIEREISNVKDINDEEGILHEVDSEKVDWLRISKMNFGGKISWVDCQKAWDHFLDPKVAQGVWTPEERSKLKELVTAAGPDSSHADWTQVAKDLGTGRTAFQCMSYYQRNFNKDILPKPWSSREDAKLIMEANKIKESVGFYHWKKISLLMENRSAADCTIRFSRINPKTSRGKFTPEEDAKILAGVEMYGLRFGKIARFLGTRSNSQVRERYMESLNPENNYMSFTYDEDLKLLKLHKQYGNAWVKISEKLCGRSAPRLLARYKQLMRWKAKKEWFDSQPNDVKAILLGKTLPVKEKQERMWQIRQHITTQLGINLSDYRRQTMDHSNGVDPDIIPPRPPFITTYRPQRILTRRGATPWSQKLSLHQMLSKNLRQLMEKDAKQRTEAGTQKLPTIMEEEHAEDLLQEAVSATIKEREKEGPRTLTKRAVTKAEALLSKAFYHGHAVSVSSLLETFKGNPKDQRFTNSGKMQKMDNLLRNAMRVRHNNLDRPGKARMFFSADGRDPEVKEAEKKELQVQVPDILTKALGTSLLKLYNNARRKHLELQTKLENISDFQDDPELMAEEAKLLHLRDMEVSERRQRLTDNRIQKLYKMYQKKYLLEGNKLRDMVRVAQRDVTDLHKKVKVKDPDLAAQFGSVWLNQDVEPKTSEETETTGSNSRSGRSRRRQTLGDAPGQQLDGKKSREVKNLEKFGLRNTKSPSGQKNTEPQDLETDAVKMLSASQIEEEQRRINLLESELCSPPSSPSQRETLPCLPPTLTSLSILKSLLLHRGRLMQLAEPLAKLPELMDVPQRKDKLVCVDRQMGGVPEPVDNLVVGSGKELQCKQSNVSVRSVDKAEVEACISLQQRETRQNFDYLQAEPLAVTNRRAEHKDFIVSHPDFNVANFSMGNDIRESPGCLPSIESDMARPQSSYELLVAPTSNAIPDYLEQEGQLVMPVGGSLVALKSDRSSNGKRKQSRETEYGETKPKSVKLSTAHQSVKVGDGARKPKPSTRTDQQPKGNRPASTTTAAATTISATVQASVRPASREQGSSTRGEQFEFPTLFNTGKEVIEIVEGSSSEEEDVAIVSRDPSELLKSDLDQIVESTSKHAKEVFKRTGIEAKRNPNIVVVGLADSGHVVHHKVGKDRMLETVETKMSYAAEDTAKYTAEKPDQSALSKPKSKERLLVKNDRNGEGGGCTSGLGIGRDGTITLGSWEEMLKEDQLLRRRASMATIRRSRDYKLLRDRMRALLLWPVLTSIVRPVKNPQLATMFRREAGEEDVGEDTEAGQEPLIKWNRKLSKSERRKYHLQTAKYRRSQYMQQKRSERKKFKAAAAAAAAGGGAASTSGEVDGSAVAAALVETQSEPVRLEDVTLAFPPEGATQSASTSNQSQSAAVVKKKRGCPRGSKKKKRVFPPARERPKRERKQPERMAANNQSQRRNKKEREPASQLPQWWKDAMLAAMMVRRDIELNRTPGNEVAIEDDEDFQDKGNYSDDDEWEQGKEAGENKGTEWEDSRPGCSGLSGSRSGGGQSAECGQDHDGQILNGSQSGDSGQVVGGQSAESGQGGDSIQSPDGQRGDNGHVLDGQRGDIGQEPDGQRGDNGQEPDGQRGDNGQEFDGQSGDNGQRVDSCQVVDGNEA